MKPPEMLYPAELTNKKNFSGNENKIEDPMPKAPPAVVVKVNVAADDALLAMRSEAATVNEVAVT